MPGSTTDAGTENGGGLTLAAVPSGRAHDASDRLGAEDRRTQVFCEAGRRLAATLAELAGSHGEDRAAVVCRELTKTHEEIKRGTLAELADWAALVSGADPRETKKKKASGAVRGEITLVVAGAARRRRRPLPDDRVSDGRVS